MNIDNYFFSFKNDAPVSYKVINLLKSLLEIDYKKRISSIKICMLCQLKSILMESVYIPAVKQVNMPGGNGLVPFSNLSKTGGILNAKKAIFAAEKATKKKKT